MTKLFQYFPDKTPEEIENIEITGTIVVSKVVTTTIANLSGDDTVYYGLGESFLSLRTTSTYLFPCGIGFNFCNSVLVMLHLPSSSTSIPKFLMKSIFFILFLSFIFIFPFVITGNC